MPAAQRFLGSARQLLRVARPPVLPEGDLEEPLQRALALTRVQVAMQGGPDGKAERRQRGCQEGTAPAGESGHAPQVRSRRSAPQASRPQNTGVSTYVPKGTLSRATISPMVAPAFTRSMVTGIRFTDGSRASRSRRSSNAETRAPSRLGGSTYLLTPSTGSSPEAFFRAVR